MLNRLASLAFFVVMLFAEQALAQEPVKENRAERFCFGQCGGTGLIHGLEVGIYFPRPMLPTLPDVQLPGPPYGPKVWSPWAVCTSLGISPSGTLVCRQWSNGEQSPLIRSPYWRIPSEAGRADCSDDVFAIGCQRPILPVIVDRPDTKRCAGPFCGGLGLHGRITLY